MPEEKPGNNREKMFLKLSAVLIAIIVLLGIVYIVVSQEKPEENDKVPYRNISAEETYNLINTSSNLRVIDVRGLEDWCTCRFASNHIPGAELNSNPTTLYNETNDILVYSINGTVGEQFCKDLIGHVKGDLYNLEGGYEAWIDSGFKPE